MASNQAIKVFWEANPCGASDVEEFEEGSFEFFEELERSRFQTCDFLFKFAQFDCWKDKKILEVGCGLGTDLLQFARAKAESYGVDLTEKAATLTRNRLLIYGLNGYISVANGEELPLPTDYFDLVYSWGVIHHAENPGSLVREMIRVCKPGGQVLAMIYHRWSLVSLQAWLYHGLLKGNPFRSARRIIAEHPESPGTKVFTREEGLALFESLRDVRLQTIVSAYDLRIARRIFLPRLLRRIVPSHWGFFMVISGLKPAKK